MNRLAQSTRRLILPSMIGALISLSGCENFNLNVNLGGPATEPPTLAAGESNCPAYHPTPDAVKAFNKAHNDTDPTIDPWAGWLLKMRAWLESGC